MGLIKLLKLYLGCVMLLLNLAESAVYVRFDRAPSARTRLTDAVFRYSIVDPNGHKLCKKLVCSMNCELDGKLLRSCSNGLMIFRNLTVNRDHSFLLNVTSSSGERNSSAYNWYIDTTRPTASIVSGERYTNAANVTVSITFSEACTGRGGFKCLNASSCDVIVDGPSIIDASTLQIVKPGIKYTLVIVLSTTESHGRVVIKLGDRFCTDEAGNLFTRTKHSILIVRFDRRLVHADLRTSIPSYDMEIGKVPRTVLATNSMEELQIFLSFSSPVVNSTKDILEVLNVNSGYFIPIPSGSHGNRQFGFELRNVSSTDIVTVELQSASIIGLSGTAASPVKPIVFLYDSTKPSVALSSSSPGVTKDVDINVVVEFTKPVFGFDASGIEVGGGKVARFRELSKALYSVTIKVVSQDLVSVLVPEGKVNDVAGNLNLASNQLEVRHYSPPAISVALHSFVTAGLLATSLAASVLAISSANLAAIGGITSGVTNVIISDPSRNLLGMTGHLQVFVLSDWFSLGLPREYSETTKGLRWLIPREKLPWKKAGIPIWSHYPSSNEAPSNLLKNYRKKSSLSAEGKHLPSSNCEFPASEPQIPSSPDEKTPTSFSKHQIPCEFNLYPTDKGSELGKFHRQNSSMTDILYALPLNSEEYFIYFLRGEPLSAANVVKKMENYKGWQDLEMNLFWLGVGGGSLLIMHFMILLFLRWRTGTSVHGLLSVPRFELFLLIFALPCIGQSAAFVIRGGTSGGIVAGALLLGFPAALLLSIFLFLIITIFMGSFFQYKEVTHTDTNNSWHHKLCIFFLGRHATGKWFPCEGTPSSFLPRFGILFEDRKGPPIYVFIDRNDPSSKPKWTHSGQSGIGRMRAVSSDDSNEDATIPTSERLLGCFRSTYIVLDLLRRLGLGILSGAYSVPSQSQCLIAFSITLVQFLSLSILKPYIRRGVHVVESVSLICEAGLFALSFYINRFNIFKNQKAIGIAMLAFLFVSFVFQLVNEWYALINCLLKLPQSQKPSFKLGVKWIGKGFVLPFLPRNYWNHVVPGSSQPVTGLVPVVPQSPEIELDNRDIDSVTQMTATVVPICSPDLHSLTDVRATTSGKSEASMQIYAGASTQAGPVSIQRSRTRSGEGKYPKELKSESENDMKKLRELAKASFTGKHQNSGEGSSSYAQRERERSV